MGFFSLAPKPPLSASQTSPPERRDPDKNRRKKKPGFRHDPGSQTRHQKKEHGSSHGHALRPPRVYSPPATHDSDPARVLDRGLMPDAGSRVQLPWVRDEGGRRGTPPLPSRPTPVPMATGSGAQMPVATALSTSHLPLPPRPGSSGQQSDAPALPVRPGRIGGYVGAGAGAGGEGGGIGQAPNGRQHQATSVFPTSTNSFSPPTHTTQQIIPYTPASPFPPQQQWPNVYYHSSTNFSVPHIASPLYTAPMPHHPIAPPAGPHMLHHKPNFYHPASPPTGILPPSKTGSSCRLTNSISNLKASLHSTIERLEGMDDLLIDSLFLKLIQLVLGTTSPTSPSDIDLNATALIQQHSSAVPMAQTPGQGPVKTPVFAKSWYYTNSRLPPHLPPFAMHAATYPLLNTAAYYSHIVYSSNSLTVPEEPHVASRSLIKADTRAGTKSMYLESVVNHQLNAVVLAIRGTKVTSTADLMVNIDTALKSPRGFLDDDENECHEGFLAVAKAMVAPVAEHLERLIVPGHKKSPSLLITGHSAGGAVAALLYAHMFSTKKECSSPLTKLRRGKKGEKAPFRRVQCVTFGCPPISAFPISSVSPKEFCYSFVNEGDPISRISAAMVTSLAKLWMRPAPRLEERLRWDVPQVNLQVPGKVLVLRRKWQSTKGEVEMVDVEKIRLDGLVFGDMKMHAIKVYEQRVRMVTGEAMMMTRP